MNGNGSEIDYKKAFEESQARLDSMQKAAWRLQTEIVKLQEENQVLVRESLSGEQKAFQQKILNHDIMTVNNQKNQELIDEIERLRVLVKELGGNPN